MRLTTPEAVKFPLYLRIPSWAEGATVAVNGKNLNVEPLPQSYVVLERAWQDGDRVSLQFPMKLAVSVWKTQANAVSVNLGPLTYSLRIGEKWEKLSGTNEWPDLAVYPTSPWNIGLEVEPHESLGILRGSEEIEGGRSAVCAGLCARGTECEGPCPS